VSFASSSASSFAGRLLHSCALRNVSTTELNARFFTTDENSVLHTGQMCERDIHSEKQPPQKLCRQGNNATALYKMSVHMLHVTSCSKASANCAAAGSKDPGTSSCPDRASVLFRKMKEICSPGDTVLAGRTSIKSPERKAMVFPFPNTLLFTKVPFVDKSNNSQEYTWSCFDDRFAWI